MEMWQQCGWASQEEWEEFDRRMEQAERDDPCCHPNDRPFRPEEGE